MKFCCLGIKKRERVVKTGKGMFQHLKVAFTKCVSAEPLTGSCRKPGEEQVEGDPRPCVGRTFPGVSIHWLPSHSPPGPPASWSGRRTNPYILPLSLHRLWTSLWKGVWELQAAKKGIVTLLPSPAPSIGIA